MHALSGDFPLLNNYSNALETSPLQLTTSTFHFQGLPWLCTLFWDLPSNQFQQFHFQGLPCFVYTLGNSPLQLTTSTFYLQGLACFCLCALLGLPF